jgi:hypothetical protein
MQYGPRLERATPALPGNARTWHESNCALARLLARHRRALKAAVATAEAIGRGIDELTPLMAALCCRTCRFCPEPCCINNTVWFDFKDLLLLHLLDCPIPACQAASDLKEACPYLGHHGCRLPPRIRPWMCIQYLCPAQRAILAQKGRFPALDLPGKIAIIETQRARMEETVVRCIKR